MKYSLTTNKIYLSGKCKYQIFYIIHSRTSLDPKCTIIRIKMLTSNSFVVNVLRLLGTLNDTVDRNQVKTAVL